ncbi:MAG TPA: hypothetical protein DEP72_06085 [Clostridiales bacterium]|nr:MAG: hypothetical protein A2Y18_01500 [Clostridiales bacterium GWD2_32_19]HCC07708.1 hypothetical protein [Clostridiales bacterium]
MKKQMNMKEYWTETVDSVTAKWNWISGKTYKDIKKEKMLLDERVRGLGIDVETLKIKLASTEIDLKASEIEKETIKMQLEEKKMKLVDLRLKVNQLETMTVTSDIEVNQILKQLNMKEEETETLKKTIFNVIAMLCAMSENEKYQDIIHIQTNTIDEIGNENHSIYVTYAGQTVEIQTQDVLERQEAKAETTKSNDKIINFNPYAMFEEEDEMEQAE